MYQMMDVFAEFERAMIVERVKAGIKRVRVEISRAKAAGEAPTKILGRPRVDAKIEAAIRKSVAAGNGILKTAKLVGCGCGTVQRIRKEMLSAGSST
jgi:DNA invertase Pin-like site-specific DNA recombinase